MYCNVAIHTRARALTIAGERVPVQRSAARETEREGEGRKSVEES